MGAGAERVGVAKTFDDVGCCALRAGDDTDDSLAGQRRSFAVDDDIFPEVILPSCIVVGDINHWFKFDVWQCIGQHFLDTLHHQLAVAEGKVDTVFHLFPVHSEFLCLSWEERQVDIWRNDRMPKFVVLFGNLVVIVADLFAKVS